MATTHLDRQLLREASDLWRQYADDDRAFFAKHHRHKRKHTAEAYAEANRLQMAAREDLPNPCTPDPFYLNVIGR
jgi:hypothetical protein